MFRCRVWQDRYGCVYVQPQRRGPKQLFLQGDAGLEFLETLTASSRKAVGQGYSVTVLVTKEYWNAD